jgi:hypothetical protein
VAKPDRAGPWPVPTSLLDRVRRLCSARRALHRSVEGGGAGCSRRRLDTASKDWRPVAACPVEVERSPASSAFPRHGLFPVRRHALMVCAPLGRGGLLAGLVASTAMPRKRAIAVI